MNVQVEFYEDFVSVDQAKFEYDVETLPFPVEAMNDRWKVADVNHCIKVSEKLRRFDWLSFFLWFW